MIKLSTNGGDDKESKADGSSKRQHRYDDEATVRIISKLRSGTRSNSSSSRASTKDQEEYV